MAFFFKVTFPAFLISISRCNKLIYLGEKRSLSSTASFLILTDTGSIMVSFSRKAPER